MLRVRGTHSPDAQAGGNGVLDEQEGIRARNPHYGKRKGVVQKWLKLERASARARAPVCVVTGSTETR